MKRICFLTLVVLATASHLAGGTVKGRISGDPSDPVLSQAVVWIDEPTAKPAGSVVVSQKGMAFSPAVAVAVVGQSIDFPNDDDTAHQVYSLSATRKFNLGFYASGETRSVVVDKAGLVDIHCYLHQHMHGMIVIVPGSMNAVANIGAAYRIGNVPPGKHVLKIWSAGTGVQTREVIVPASGEATADLSAR